MTAPLWNAAEIVAAVSGTPSGAIGAPASGISIDSRSLNPGDLFIALTGPNNDGHDHVAGALAKGAAAAIVSCRPPGLAEDAPLIEVADTQAALEALGHASRARSGAGILAITGSVGKTSTKELAALAFAGLGSVHASAGSLNNHWGVPLSLSRMARDARWGIFELGMNHSGEIAALTRQVRPKVAIVTNVEPAHLEFFSGVEAIADAKAEIFESMGADGVAVLNLDNPLFPRLEAAAKAAGLGRIITFGETASADAVPSAIDLGPESSKVTARILRQEIAYEIGQPGLHLVLNSLSVLAAVAAFGEDPAAVAPRFAGYGGVAGRGRRHVVRGVTIVDESYNASPAAMRAAFAVLGRMPVGPNGRRIAVLGDMRELGADGPALHKALAGPIDEAGIDLVFGCGELTRSLVESLPLGRRGGWAETAALLAPLVLATIRPGDVVTIKGSLGSRMADVLKPLLGAES